jgi:hypothetical protein
MNAESAIEGGITSATTLTILHEIVRMFDKDAPHMQDLGMQAISKLFDKANVTVPDDDKLYFLSMAGELIGNTLFYSLTGAGGKNNVWLRGALLGLSAGIGSVVLPEKLGLSELPSSRTTKTKLMSISYYLLAGIIAALVTEKLEERRRKKEGQV